MYFNCQNITLLFDTFYCLFQGQYKIGETSRGHKDRVSNIALRDSSNSEFRLLMFGC